MDHNKSFKEFQLSGDVKSKSEMSYGEVICRHIEGTIGGVQGYMYLRNARFKKNRDLAHGVVDMRQYVDMLGFDGKQNFANINWKSISLVNTFISRLVGRWKTLNERIQVQAIDPFSVKAKQEKVDEAEFNLENKDKIAMLEQASGVPVVPQDSFMPEDKDELDNWKLEFNRLPEEIGYEMAANNILEMNGWFDVLKEIILHDSAEVGLVGTHTSMDREGIVSVRRVKPENMIYSYSDFPDFRDTSWRGEVVSMKITELRDNYSVQNGGILTEEDIFKIAQTAKEYQLNDKISWNQSWAVSFLRPYDDWNVDVVLYELKSFDRDPYVVTKTKVNNSTIIKKVNSVDAKIGANEQLYKDGKWNIYKGAYVRGCMKVLEWGVKKNMIRPQDPKEIGDAEFSYSFYMYQTYNMRNLAVPEKIEEPVDQMIIARLKIQQLVSKMVPAGAAINVDAMQELDLGLADTSKPLEVQKIWEQTGKLYYRGRDAQGDPIPVPISELANNGFAAQMQSLIQLYQFHYQVLRDEVGVNEFAEGQSVKPRTGLGIVEQQTNVSYNATDYMYDAYLRLMEETAKKISCLVNKSVSFGAKAYRHLLKEEEVKNRNFSTKIMMLPTNDEIAKLEAQLNNAIASTPDLVLYMDTFKIIRMAKENIKLAEMYYRQCMKRMIRSKSEQASKNAQENAQIQMESAKAKADGDKDLEGVKNEGKEKQILLQGAFDLLKTGVNLPPELAEVVSSIMKNVAMPLAMQNMQTEQAIAQQFQQQQQAEAQGQIAPEGMMVA